MAFFEKAKLSDSTGLVINPATQDTQFDGNNILRGILSVLLAPLGYDKSLQRYRQTSVIESGTVTTVTTVSTVTTCTTVSSVTNIANIGSYSAQMQILDNNRTSWALCVRARIT